MEKNYCKKEWNRTQKYKKMAQSHKRRRNENQKSTSDCFKSGNMSIKYETTQDTIQQRCQTALDTQTIPSLDCRWRHRWPPLCLDTELSDLIFGFVQYYEVADKCLCLVFSRYISLFIILLVFVLSNPKFELYFWVSIHGKHQVTTAYSLAQSHFTPSLYPFAISFDH